MADNVGTEFTGGASRIFAIDPYWGDPQEGLALDRAVVTGGGPMVEMDPLSGIPLWSASFTFGLGTWQEISAFVTAVKFFMGQVKSFWMPSWQSDFVLAADTTSTGQTTLRVKAANFDRLVSLFAAQAGLANPTSLGVFIITLNGTRYFRGIRNITVDRFGNQDLVIRTALGSILTRGQVQLFSLLRRVRLVQDNFMLRYTTDAVADCGLSVMQAPREGEDFR